MTRTLPDAGTDWQTLKTRMADYANGDVAWRDGKTAVYVFNAGPEVEQVQKEAYVLFMSENGLGPAAFPSLKRMEDEVVGFGLSLLHGPEGASGAITSGGGGSSPRSSSRPPRSSRRRPSGWECPMPAPTA